MIKQIDWACDENCLICFDREPIVQVRVIQPGMSTLEKQSVKRYPFVCRKPLKVLIYDNQKFKQYHFTIRESYCFDGASVPRFFWRIIGSNTNNEFLVASLIHDVMCENHKYINYDRELSSKVFKALLIASGVSEIKANIMYHSVDLYQALFCDWEKKEK